MLSFVLLAVLALLAPSQARNADLTKSEEAAVRSIIDSVLENVRDIILNGDPELGIPVLDPLVVNNFEFEVNEDPIVHAEGGVSQVRLEGIGGFVVEQSKLQIGLLPPKATVTIAIRVPTVSGVGNYKLDGEAHTRTDISVHADGDFTVIIKGMYFYIKTAVTFPNYSVKSIDVTLGLGDVFIEVHGAGEVGEIINNEAAIRIEEWLAEHRTELEDALEQGIKYIIESAL